MHAAPCLETLCLAVLLFVAAYSSRGCSEDLELQVGDEFHGVSPDAVLRVSLKGHGRSVEARRRSVTAHFQYEIKDGGRTSRCPATAALDAAVEQTYSVKVLGTITRKELERLQRIPSSEFIQLDIDIDIDMKESEPFELKLLAPAKPPRRGQVRAYVPDGDIGFVTDARLLELFDIDCTRSS